MSEDERGPFASPTLASQFVRGAIGFGLIGCALALSTRIGPASLVLAVPGLIALRGCPTCWMAGLIQTISAGRLERSCGDEGCGLRGTQATRAPDD